MSQGSQSPGVRTLQEAINLCYSDRVTPDITIDGIFGEKTETALRKVQAEAGAGVDGVYGPETRQRMLWPLRHENGSLANYCTSGV